MTIHHLEGYLQSIYLVEETHGLMLLDGCCRADVPLIKQTITQSLKRPFTDLKLVVVTHMHPDHAGAAKQLKRLTGCKIASSKHETHWYRGLSGWLMYFTDLALARWMAKRKGKNRSSLIYWPKLKPDYQLADGDPLPHFEQWHILETPGHTDRDLSVIHQPSRRIYVADLMVKVKGRFIPPFPIFYPNRYRRSIERIVSLQPAALWLAHGEEIVFTSDDQNHLLQLAPKQPVTHWRVAKIKLLQILKSQNR